MGETGRWGLKKKKTVVIGGRQEKTKRDKKMRDECYGQMCQFLSKRNLKKEIFLTCPKILLRCCTSIDSTVADVSYSERCRKPSKGKIKKNG
jgi:hypothetical protein